MTTYKSIKCADGCYCHAIYTFGPCIRDYMVQVLVLVLLWLARFIFNKMQITQNFLLQILRLKI